MKLLNTGVIALIATTLSVFASLLGESPVVPFILLAAAGCALAAMLLAIKQYEKGYYRTFAAHAALVACLASASGNYSMYLITAMLFFIYFVKDQVAR